MVGLAALDFPDNSVVYHASRLAGNLQDVFVGGCALLIDVGQPLGFFPNVYKEDWLFMFDAVAERWVAQFGTVRQSPYNPFLSSERTTAEEFGDSIAEGLMASLHSTEANFQVGELGHTVLDTVSPSSTRILGRRAKEARNPGALSEAWNRQGWR
jgi:hypothetical protein